MQLLHEDAWDSSLKKVQGQVMLSVQGMVRKMLVEEPAQQAAQQCMQSWAKADHSPAAAQ